MQKAPPSGHFSIFSVAPLPGFLQVFIEHLQNMNTPGPSFYGKNTRIFSSWSKNGPSKFWTFWVKHGKLYNFWYIYHIKNIFKVPQHLHLVFVGIATTSNWCRITLLSSWYGKLIFEKILATLSLVCRNADKWKKRLLAGNFYFQRGSPSRFLPKCP